MPITSTILLIALPALAAAHAAHGRASVRRRLAWPTTAARRSDDGSGLDYTVRGRTYHLPAAPEGAPDGPGASDARVHYDPDDPQHAVLAGTPLPPLVGPVLRAMAAGAGVAAAIHWLA